MADIVLALKSKWLELILSGKKTAEARRVLPKKLNPGDKVFLYCRRFLHGHAYVKKVLRTGNDCVDYGLYSLSIHWSGDRALSHETLKELEDYMSKAKPSRCGYIILQNATRYDDPHPWRGSTPQNFIYYK